MPVTNICGKDVPQCVTFDSTNSAGLGDAQTAFPGAHGHSNTADAVTNLLNCHGATRVMMVGHGIRGKIFTGMDDGDTNNIGSNNKGEWKAELERFKNQGLDELIFCSCFTGFGQSGDTLLKNVVEAINVQGATHAKVSAFTGVLTLTQQGVICHAGEWKTVEPQAVLHPMLISASTFSLRDMTMDLKLFDQNEYKTISADNVSLISYHRADLKGRGPLIARLEGCDTEKLLSMINFSAPFELEGEPLAVVTGEVEIEYLVGKEIERKGFTVYSDMLLRDKQHPTTFYNASPDLASSLWGFMPLR
ncbi:MAG: hypothetical protein AUG51_00835 [Acidobacteria bacterium 13_1_20CM_3_53_8]|nr:MAG: hypothetical protein AUG51_00835 [Acidobacteria bacterium 13_1_20CM_3_53_8]